MHWLCDFWGNLADLHHLVQHTARVSAVKARALLLGDLQEDQDTGVHLDRVAALADLHGQLDPARVLPLAGHDANHGHHSLA